MRRRSCQAFRQRLSEKAPAVRRLRARGARQRLISPGLDLLHLAGGQAVFGVVVVSAGDDRPPTCPRRTAMAIHQMYQIMAKPSTKARPPRIDAGTGALRHVDVVIAVGPAIGDAALLHLVEGVDVAHLRQHREIVGRRRRSGQPFQRPPVPRVAAEIERLLPLPDADDQLHDQKDDAEPGSATHRARPTIRYGCQAAML